MLAMWERGDFPKEVDEKEVVKRFVKSVGKGLLKVMSKMGISTYQSYCGAQIFDALGLKSEFVSKYFFGTHTTIEGVGLAEVAEETVRVHRNAFGDSPVYRTTLDVAANTPSGSAARTMSGGRRPCRTCSMPSAATRRTSTGSTPAPSTSRRTASPRSAACSGSSRPASRSRSSRLSLPRRSSAASRQGAMSFGSISREAHETLAIAMNTIGGKSNTGEGGEEAERFKPLPDGRSKRSAIKQVASGRFGVTTEYLANSDMMQIKMAQGAKPGEGGQLPGHKVDAVIAKVRTRPRASA